MILKIGGGEMAPEKNIQIGKTHSKTSHIWLLSKIKKLSYFLPAYLEENV